MKPKVSIILTTYNRPEMLNRAINSVMLQTFLDFELLIMDDNSDNPDQLEILKRIEILDQKIRKQWHISKDWNHPIRILRSDIPDSQRKLSTRYATMVNWGLKEARGEYITYLCDDDYYLPQRLQRMVDFLDLNTEAMVVYGSQKIVELKDGQEVPYAGEIRKAIPIQNDASCQVDHSSVMMRRKLVELVGYWDDDPNYWGSADAVYWKKINNAGFPFYGIDEILDVHVYHDGSWTKDGRWEKEL